MNSKPANVANGEFVREMEKGMTVPEEEFVKDMNSKPAKVAGSELVKDLESGRKEEEERSREGKKGTEGHLAGFLRGRRSKEGGRRKKRLGSMLSSPKKGDQGKKWVDRIAEMAKYDEFEEEAMRHQQWQEK